MQLTLKSWFTGAQFVPHPSPSASSALPPGLPHWPSGGRGRTVTVLSARAPGPPLPVLTCQACLPHGNADSLSAEAAPHLSYLLYTGVPSTGESLSILLSGRCPPASRASHHHPGLSPTNCKEAIVRQPASSPLEYLCYFPLFFWNLVPLLA